MTKVNKHEGKPVFASREEYEAFRKRYRERVVPALKEYAEAHARSQDKAKRRWVD